MNVLMDTNVLSEAMQQQPDAAVCGRDGAA